MEQLIFIGIFLTVYGVYHLSLFPSIAGGDSGELLAESCHFGVSHPPGKHSTWLWWIQSIILFT